MPPPPLGNPPTLAPACSLHPLAALLYILLVVAEPLQLPPPRAGGRERSNRGNNRFSKRQPCDAAHAHTQTQYTMMTVETHSTMASEATQQHQNSKQHQQQQQQQMMAAANSHSEASSGTDDGQSGAESEASPGQAPPSKQAASPKSGGASSRHRRQRRKHQQRRKRRKRPQRLQLLDETPSRPTDDTNMLSSLTQTLRRVMDNVTTTNTMLESNDIRVHRTRVAFVRVYCYSAA